MTALLEFSFRRWSAWAPTMTDAGAWQAWAREETSLAAGEETAPVKAMPPLLRRRAHPLGRAALEVLYAPTLGYADQPLVFCSRHGEISRSLAIQQMLAAEGSVSPQEFSMSVHNAIPGLFLIARQSRAPVIALASENRLALSGMTEALSQLADGASSVILVFCEAPLSEPFSPFIDNEPTCFAFALEVTAGKDFRLVHDEAPRLREKKPSALPVNSLLSLLRFVLDETQSALPLTEAADWRLQHLAPEVGHA
ncbi:MAG: beta-ketoacyl synthase chain length factor [Burkholderiales bacterium]|jgi:hypothetical protein|nr:beta-ketoacyl synthase chain length factor [Burkholderiales bacterium]